MDQLIAKIERELAVELGEDGFRQVDRTGEANPGIFAQ